MPRGLEFHRIIWPIKNLKKESIQGFNAHINFFFNNIIKINKPNNDTATSLVTNQLQKLLKALESTSHLKQN